LALYNRGMVYYDKRDVERATRDMNQAIKLNPNFATAVHDRGITNYDKHDYDRTIAADALIKLKPAYAVSFSGHGSAYENRRAGDRIIQDADQPIRSNQYNAFAYSPEDYPLPGPPKLTPISAPEPEPVAEAAPTAAAVPAAAPQAEIVPLPQPRPLPRPAPKIRQSRR
jgi:hypothetical protein